MRDFGPFLGLPLWVWLFVFPSVFALACLFARQQMRPVLRPLWRVLDGIYLAAGVVAACFMVTILLLIATQMVARWSGIPFPGSTEFAGYAMASTSFFALAHALTRGAHIRVSIFLNMGQTKRWMDPLAIFIAAVTATYFARFAIKTNILSELINDTTQGQDQVPQWLITFLSLPANAPGEWGRLWAERGQDWVFTPLWIPQLPMSIGAVLLAVCLWDLLSRTLIEGENPIRGEGVE